MPPPDTRRIAGPESSQDYRIFVSTEKPKVESLVRPDGRKDDEHRPVCKSDIVLTYNLTFEPMKMRMYSFLHKLLNTVSNY